MKVLLNVGNEEIENYSQRDLKNLLTEILSFNGETYETFAENLCSIDKIKIVEENEVILKRNIDYSENKISLELDISRDDAKKIIDRVGKNHFVDLKNGGFAKVLKIYSRNFNN